MYHDAYLVQAASIQEPTPPGAQEMQPAATPNPRCSQISPERVRLNSPVARVHWGQEGGVGGDAEVSSSARSHGHSHPCVVEYTTRKRSSGGEGVGGGKEEACTRRIRCRRVVVTVSLGVLKVRSNFIRLLVPSA